MKKDELKKALSREVDKWSIKQYDELCAIASPICYDETLDKERFQVEVQVVERRNSFVQLMITVDDGSLRRTLSPLAESVVVYKNGPEDQ